MMMILEQQTTFHTVTIGDNRGRDEYRHGSITEMDTEGNHRESSTGDARGWFILCQHDPLLFVSVYQVRDL